MKCQQLFTFSSLFSIIVLQCYVGSYLVTSAEETPPTPVQTQILEKYKCTEEEAKSYDNHNKNIYLSNATSDSVNTVNHHNEEHDYSSKQNLECSKDDILYLNVTHEKFMRGEYNGVLELTVSTTSKRKFNPNKFCIAKFNPHHNVSHHTTSDSGSDSDQATFTLAICNDNDSSSNNPHSHPNSGSKPKPLEIRKCCKPNERLDIRSLNQGGSVEYQLHCVEIPPDSKQREWKPAIFESTSDDYSQHKDLKDFKDAVYLYGFPNCSGTRHSLNNSRDIWFMLLEDSTVQVGLKFWFKPVWLPVEDNKSCLDEFVDHDPTSFYNETEIDSHKIYHKNQLLLYCNIASFDDYLFHRRLFGGMCVTAAGIVFVLLIIYVAIWDKQNLAGWTQFNIFVALFFVVLMEGLRTLFDVNALKVQSTPGCVIIAAIAQYFFFALNTTWTVMCFDLFYMFWKLETTSKTVARYRGRLVLYLLFSWVLPMVIVCLAFYFTHTQETEAMEEMRGVYAFAHRRCSSPIRKLGFQTQGLMFLLNLLFFLLTTALIWRHRRGINPARKKSRHERHTWRSVCLFMKLVIVMGVTSLSIPVDYFFGSSDPLNGISVGLRLIHFIPFFAVLFIFGFNEKNVVLISQKYPRVGKYFGIVACSAGGTASDTANHSRSGNANRISEHPSSQT